MELIIITAIILFVLIIGMSVGIMFGKNKKFPETHVGHNKNLKKHGISCAKNEDMGNKPVNTCEKPCNKCGNIED